MKCPNCDRENRDVARFCQYCGASLATAKTPGPIDTKAQFSAVERPTEPPQERTPDQIDFAKESASEAPENIDNQEAAESLFAPEPVEPPETDQAPPDSLLTVEQDEMPPLEVEATEPAATEIAPEEFAQRTRHSWAQRTRSKSDTGPRELARRRSYGKRSDIGRPRLGRGVRGTTAGCRLDRRGQHKQLGQRRECS